MKKWFIFVITLVSLMVLTSCDFKFPELIEPNPNKPTETIPNENESDFNIPDIGEIIKPMDVKAVALSGGKEEYDYSTGLIEEGFKKALTRFCLSLSANYVMDDDMTNVALSPISIYMALAMALDASAGNTRRELEQAMGITRDEMIENMLKVYSQCNIVQSENFIMGEKKIITAEDLCNSLWFDQSCDFVMDGVKSLSNNCFCDLYQAPFSTQIDKANEAMNEYVKTKTRGLIDPKFNFDSTTLFTILNTYYLKDVWQGDGRDLAQTRSNVLFQNSDNTLTNVNLYGKNYEYGKPLETKNCTAFYVNSYSGTKMMFYIPKDGYSALDVFTEENLNLIDEMPVVYRNEVLKERYYTRVNFPEFTAESKKDIIPLLKNKYGINDLFTEDCDFSNLLTNKVQCGSIVHGCKLKVDKKGIEGAAFTAMGVAGSAGPDEYRNIYYDLNVDRSFGFVIKNAGGFVVFSGIVNKL